jgi:hemoglobin
LFVREELMATEGASSLYERLGGVYSIATVIDDFIDRIMVDPRLNANPRVDEAHHRVPPAGFKYLVTEMVCWARKGLTRVRLTNRYDANSSSGAFASFRLSVSKTSVNQP